MKRALLSIVIIILAMTKMTAQTKSYVTVYCPLTSYSSLIKLSGDIPAGMKTDYSYTDFGNTRAVVNYYLIGDVLNLLAANGFTVEKMNSWYNGTDSFAQYLLSKSASSSPSKIESVKADSNDTETTEVARYNLQGIPVTSADKGVQIIVYSNYTTKTVVVE